MKVNANFTATYEASLTEKGKAMSHDYTLKELFPGLDTDFVTQGQLIAVASLDLDTEFEQKAISIAQAA